MSLHITGHHQHESLAYVFNTCYNAPRCNLKRKGGYHGDGGRPSQRFWVLIGILFWPELTLCIILWMLGHPILGIIALLLGSTTSVKEVVKERGVDQRGNTIRERTVKTEY